MKDLKRIYKEKNIIYYLDENGQVIMQYNLSKHYFLIDNKKVGSDTAREVYICYWSKFYAEYENLEDYVTAVIFDTLTTSVFCKEEVQGEINQIIYNGTINILQSSKIINNTIDREVVYQIISETVIALRNFFLQAEFSENMCLTYISYVVKKIQGLIFKNKNITEKKYFKILGYHPSIFRFPSTENQISILKNFYSYLIEIKKNNLSQIDYKRLQMYFKGQLLDLFEVRRGFIKLYDKNFNLLLNVTKILDNDFKNKSYVYPASIAKFMLHIVQLRWDNNLQNVLDTNKGTLSNLRRLKTYYAESQQQLLQKSLQKINIIHNKIFTINDEKYIIKVPQNANDLLNEGKQQNNCVGTQYNNSILYGNDYIYFIRKYKNPDKSYVTCRYNVNAKSTCECKMINNTEVNNQEVINIIDEIDNIIINEFLKE